MKRFFRVIQFIVMILLLIITIPLARVGLECHVWENVTPTPPPTSPEREAVIAKLSDYPRLEEQTYLNLPEWYIVYSADEYAAFITKNRPSQFPYFQAIGQYWGSYYGMCAVTRGRYPFNSGYHLALAVIGTSFTVENLLKGIYENSIGWLTEMTSSDALTEEDAYARAVATEYGHFIHTIPWYEFPFGEKLAGLWAQTSGWGPNMIRKWERKVGLSLEYGIKTVYGGLIKQGNSATYAPEELRLQLWVTHLTPELAAQTPQIKIIKQIDKNSAIISLPRYQEFTDLLPKLVQHGLQFVEIAGNDEILVTAIAPQEWRYNMTEGEFLFAMPLTIDPTRNRLVIKVPVKSLHLVLNELAKQSITIEHVYDY